MNIRALARPEIVAMKPYESARNSADADGILLNANEAPLPLLEGATGTALNRYPPPQPAALRSRMAELYQVPEDQVLVTRGSDEGIDLLTRVFCTAGKSSIIECPPCFGMYRIAANIQGAAVESAPRNTDLSVNVQELCETIQSTDSARLVFLTSPNNPTGDLLARDALEQVMEVARDKALVVLDEAYIEFCEAESAANLVATYPNLVVLRTLSKAWAAAGLRCGTVIANPDVIDLLQRVMAPYPLSAPAIDMAMECTTGPSIERQREMLNLICQQKSRLLAFLENQSWVQAIWPGEANFVLLRVPDAPELVVFCAKNGVKIRDFSTTPMLENCVRVSIGSESEMTALKKTLTNYGEQA
jgi:histidinol-phosphate aminotransferase